MALAMIVTCHQLEHEAKQKHTVRGIASTLLSLQFLVVCCKYVSHSNACLFAFCGAMLLCSLSKLHKSEW